MNKISDFLTGFINTLKTDKKKLILFIGVLLVVGFLIFSNFSGKKQTAQKFGDQLNSVISNQFCNISGDVTLSNKNYKVSFAKSGNNKQFGFVNDDIDYSYLVTKYNNNIFLNYNAFREKDGLANIKCAAPVVTDEKDKKSEAVPITILSVFINSLNSDAWTYTESENYYETKLTTVEMWQKYFAELSVAFADNKTAILANYTDAAVMGHELDEIIAATKKLSESTSSTNSISLTLTHNTETDSYTLTIDISVDFDKLPSYITADSFNSNKFTAISTLNITFNENTVNMPSGYVYPIGTNTVNGFISECWDSLFKRVEYKSSNEVSEKPDSVTNIIKLGGTTETYQYVFDKDGVTDGVLIVSTTDRNILTNYINKYGNSSMYELIVHDKEQNTFSLSFQLSKTAIDSVNKIATTPRGLAAFFKTAEGVIPIV